MSLKELGYTPIVHKEATSLSGYLGDQRTQKAHIVLPRSQVGIASNDIGFERLGDGKYAVHVSQFDQNKWSSKAQKLTQLYAKNTITKFVRKNSSKYSVTSQTTKVDGTIQLRLRRR